MRVLDARLPIIKLQKEHRCELKTPFHGKTWHVKCVKESIGEEIGKKKKKKETISGHLVSGELEVAKTNLMNIALYPARSVAEHKLRIN